MVNNDDQFPLFFIYHHTVCVCVCGKENIVSLQETLMMHKIVCAAFILLLY